MLFDDTYKTIQSPAEGIFRDKGSKFIAYAFPFSHENDLKSILADIKTAHPKARHHCYAYRLTPDKNIYRVNDDGEPSGTAGRPILNVLLSKELTNILVVVVRYFGGTLLGVPGLINAYKTATEDAILNAQIVEQTLNDVYELKFDYLLMNDVMKIIKEDKLEILSQEFDLNCVIKLSIRKADLNKTLPKLENLRSIEITFLNAI
ncbi:YigZ family protein [Pedobacter aquae]|uniref:YigZ family protein n=1 Tax=Pedobacter aquae TaxID=2605747 RepID=A0A5C0VEY4_9SPHI|nr:YigZ family protein [Pedobacter aquae]QEK51185.1 YigZ family protein [Pedobacter aquae]